MGVNVSLNGLSNFISHQQIGLTGKAFVLDEQGNLLVPTPNNLDAQTQEIANTVVHKAFEQFQKNQSEQIILEKDTIRYLVYIGHFPVHLETEWLIAIAVPFNDFFATFLSTQHQTILISLTILLISGILVFLFSKYISVPIIKLAQEVDRIRHFDFAKSTAINSKIEEIITLDTSITAMRGALSSFTKYIPKDVVKTLIEQGKDIEVGGQRKELTILFSDVKDFTTTSEALTPEELMPMLAKYFDVLSKIILQTEGTIDKYIGDSIMSFWGAPQEIPNHAKVACQTALRCHKASNIEGKERGLPPWKTRFGIHTGDVIVGNIGTADRINYTVIGDVVNTASRLTTINKDYRTSILISEVVDQKIGPGFITRPIDNVAVKGKKNKITIYELVGTTEGELIATPAQQKLCSAFKATYLLLIEGKSEQAEAAFREIAQEFPEDGPTQIHLERLQKKKIT